MADHEPARTSSSSYRHRLHWFVVLGTSIAAGCILLPLARQYPTAVHDFAGGLLEWQRIVLGIGLGMIVAELWFRLFNPRCCHLLFAWSHPPTWTALLVALWVVMQLDLKYGLSPKHYTASELDWVVFAGVPLGIVGTIRAMNWAARQWSAFRAKGAATRVTPGTLADWDTFERWLRNEQPSELDYFGTKPISDRVFRLLQSGIGSIGLVGPFGAGKSSILEWVSHDLQDRRKHRRQHLLISYHKCWGFEDSASAIHRMLSDGIHRVAELIDTFQISSLPESYRRTFSAGGVWFESISQIIFAQRDPDAQFQQLAELLTDIDGRLVFIIEDLDRNGSENFDIQDVLAFLHRLKGVANLSFVLTGGLTSTLRIDFPKLCDHIEYVPTIGKDQVSRLVGMLREACWSKDRFPHHDLGTAVDDIWSLDSNLLSGLSERHYPLDAVQRLLNTPRNLRHALSRTWSAWQQLYGELDWDHLLVMNVLRFAAPEAFSFVLRRWEELSRSRRDFAGMTERMTKIHDQVKEDWEKVIESVEWDPVAAQCLINFLFRGSCDWFGSRAPIGNYRTQGVEHSRYWKRVLAEELNATDVRDQAVAQAYHAWYEDPSADSVLVTELCSNAEYARAWEHLAYPLIGPNTSKILTLAENMHERILRTHGPAASEDSPGFVPLWGYARGTVPADGTFAEWLRSQVIRAARVSINFIHALRDYWAGSHFPQMSENDQTALRRCVIDACRGQILDCGSLSARLSPAKPRALRFLVLRPEEAVDDIEQLTEWSWLAPILLEALRGGGCRSRGAGCVPVVGRLYGGQR